MPKPTSNLQSLESRRASLLTGLASIGDMRPGSLVESYTRCGKPNCRCAQPGAIGHGPHWSLTRKEGGRTISLRVPTAVLPQVQTQITEYKRFRSLEKELIEVSEKIADARLEATWIASEGMAKKGATVRRSQKPLLARSGAKSKRS